VEAGPGDGKGVNPYAPPSGDAAPFEGSTEGPAGYESQATLVQVLVGVIGLMAAVKCVTVATVVVIQFGELAKDQVALLLQLSPWANKLHRVTFLLCAVPFAMFLVRSNKNARAMTSVNGRELAATVAKFTPASMAWWFFVPVMNFVMPAQAVKAVWSCSAPAAARSWPSDGDHVVTWWWGAFLVSWFYDSASAYIARPGMDPTSNNILVALHSILWVVTCTAAIQMLRALERRQATRAAELARRRRRR